VGVDTHEQRPDSTAIRPATRGLTRLGILVETIGKFLRQPRRCHHNLQRKWLLTCRLYVNIEPWRVYRTTPLSPFRNRTVCFPARALSGSRVRHATSPGRGTAAPPS
jgi:hypothetical protein